MAVSLFRIIIVQSAILKITLPQQVTQYVSVAPPPVLPSSLPPIAIQRPPMHYPGYPKSYTSSGPTSAPTYDTGSTYTSRVYGSEPEYRPTSYSTSYPGYPSYSGYETSTVESSRSPTPAPPDYLRYSSSYSATYNPTAGYKHPCPSKESVPLPAYRIVLPPGYPTPAPSRHITSSPNPIYRRVPSSEYHQTTTAPSRSEASVILSSSNTPRSPSQCSVTKNPPSQKTITSSSSTGYSVSSSYPITTKTQSSSNSLPPTASDPSNLTQTYPPLYSPHTSVSKSSSNCPKPSDDSKEQAVDSKLLNNLAVALQLLIVSNILNKPPPSENNAPLHDIYESVTKMSLPLSLPSQDSRSPSYHLEATSTTDSSTSSNKSPSLDQLNNVYESNIIDQIPVKSFQQICESSAQIPVSSLQQYYGQIPSKSMQQLPNANFLSSSGFSSGSLGTLPLGSFGIGTLGSNSLGSTGNSNPRSNYALMSPYEALGSNSQYSDPILTSPYGNSFNSNDFQSPYSAMLADDNDLFSMADIF